MLARTALPASCAGLLLFAIGCVSTQPLGPTDGPIAQQQAVKPEVPAKKFVDDWFKLYFEALSDLTATSGRWVVNDKGERVWIDPEFGLSRIPRLSGHRISRATEYIGGYEKLRKLLDEGAYYGQSWGLGAGTAPMTKDNMQVHFRQMSFPLEAPFIESSVTEPFLAFAKESLAKLEKGEIPTMKYKDWDVQARLMRLTDKECLRCHVDNKLNDPVAVFLFATRPK